MTFLHRALKREDVCLNYAQRSFYKRTGNNYIIIMLFRHIIEAARTGQTREYNRSL